MKTPKSEGEDVRFESLLKRLEKSVQDLEGGALGLDSALEVYEQGVRLLARCRKLLDEAERKVALVTSVDATGRPQLAPFDAAATIDE